MSPTATAAPESTAGRFGSGHSVRRIEDPTLVTGTGRYVDDVSIAGQLHVVLLRSPYAHARIASIDDGGAHFTCELTPIADGEDPGAEVEALFRLVHQRRPQADELAFARAFLAAHEELEPPASSASQAKAAAASFGRLAELAQVLLLSNETAFVD